MDWYVFLFAGMAVLISFMNEIGEHRMVHQYALGRRDLGLGMGSVALLSPLISGAVLMLPFYATTEYGLFGGVAIAIAGGVALLAYVKVVGHLRRPPLSANHIVQLLDGRLTPLARRLFLIVLFIGTMEGLIVQVSLASLVLRELFSLSLFGTAVLLMLYGFVYAGMGGRNSVFRFSFFHVTVVFVACVIISLSLFLVHGIQPLYKAFSVGHQTLLAVNVKEVITFVGAVVMVFMGKCLLDQSFAQSAFAVKAKRIVSVVRITAFYWVAILFAFTGVALFLLARQVAPETPFTLLKGWLDEGNGLVFYWFIAAFLVACVAGIGASLTSVVSLLLFLFENGKGCPFNERRLVEWGYVGALFLGVATTLFVVRDELFFVGIVRFFAVLYAASVCPLLLFIFTPQRWNTLLPAVLIFAAMGGWWYSLNNGTLLGIWLSVLLSALLTGCLAFVGQKGKING